MTELQKYEAIKSLGCVEIRRYYPHISAEVMVQGDLQSGGNRGFRPLANYIFSNNIAMTAPVIIQQEGSDRARVKFIMPEGLILEQMPEAKGDVRLKENNEETCAAITFRGYTTAAKVRRMKERLLGKLASESIEVTGPIRVARFDPPWKPGFARRNEIVVPIRWNY